jgi:hypothetical protein
MFTAKHLFQFFFTKNNLTMKQIVLIFAPPIQILNFFCF